MKPHVTTCSTVEVEKPLDKTAMTSSEEEEEEEEVVNVVDSGSAAAKGKPIATKVSSDDSSSSESSGYLMSQSNPAEIVEALGLKNARIIGGQVIGNIRFESG